MPKFVFNPTTGKLDAVKSQAELDADYLRLDTANDPLTGSLTSQEVTPDTDASRNLGTKDTNRFNNVFGITADFKAGDGTSIATGGHVFGNTVKNSTGLTQIEASNGFGTKAAFAGGLAYNNGTESVQVRATKGGSFAWGSAFTYGNFAAEVTATGYASVSFGYSFSNTGVSKIRSTGSGSFVGGYAHGANAAQIASILASGSGSLALGFVTSGTSFDGLLQAGGSGSIAVGSISRGEISTNSLSTGGFAQGFVTAGGKIQSTRQACFTQGSATGDSSFILASNTAAMAIGTVSNTSSITANSAAAFAHGSSSSGSVMVASGFGSFLNGATLASATMTAGPGGGATCLGIAVLGNITSSGGGAFATGYAIQGDITASGLGSVAAGFTGVAGFITASANGSLAFGNILHNSIIASQKGAMAIGYSNASGDILASAVNAIQFGIGTNIIADSLQVGTGFQTIGTSGNTRFDGSLTGNTTTVITTTHTAGDEHVILVDDVTAGGIVTITLPTSVEGVIYYIKKLGNSHNVIVDGNASELIDGSLTKTILFQYTTMELIADGTGWNII